MVQMNNPNEAPRIKLVDGEEVPININGVCRPQQVLIRLGANLVAGILNVNGDSAVYLWMKDADGIYQYVGDVSVYDNGDGSADLQVVPGNGNVNSPLEKKSLELHRKQVNELVGCLKQPSFHSTKMRFLVGVPGAVPKE
jgi:hypothetical protein